MFLLVEDLQKARLDRLVECSLAIHCRPSRRSDVRQSRKPPPLSTRQARTLCFIRCVRKAKKKKVSSDAQRKSVQSNSTGMSLQCLLFSTNNEKVVSKFSHDPVSSEITGRKHIVIDDSNCVLDGCERRRLECFLVLKKLCRSGQFLLCSASEFDALVFASVLGRSSLLEEPNLRLLWLKICLYLLNENGIFSCV